MRLFVLYLDDEKHDRGDHMTNAKASKNFPGESIFIMVTELAFDEFSFDFSLIRYFLYHGWFMTHQRGEDFV